jgi:hypothetical protein
MIPSYQCLAMCESDTSHHKESPNNRTNATHSHHAHHHTNQQSTTTHALVSLPSPFALPPTSSIAVTATTTAHCHGPTFAAGFVRWRRVQGGWPDNCSWFLSMLHAPAPLPSPYNAVRLQCHAAIGSQGGLEIGGVRCPCKMLRY